MMKCIETWVARIGDPIHTRESEYVMGIIRDRIHIYSCISEFKASYCLWLYSIFEAISTILKDTAPRSAKAAARAGYGAKLVAKKFAKRGSLIV